MNVFFFFVNLGIVSSWSFSFFLLPFGSSNNKERMAITLVAENPQDPEAGVSTASLRISAKELKRKQQYHQLHHHEQHLYHYHQQQHHLLIGDNDCIVDECSHRDAEEYNKKSNKRHRIVSYAIKSTNTTTIE